MLISIENAFNFLSPEYLELFRTSIATAFQHQLWLAQFYGGLVEANHSEPLIVVVRDQNGKLLMVLPLVRRRYGFLRVIEAADLGVSDYVAPVVGEKDLERILGDDKARRDIKLALGPHDLVRIGKLPPSALGLAGVLGAPEPRSMGTNAYAVRLTESFVDWRTANMSASYCKELDKKSRQLHRKGASVRFEEVTDPLLVRRGFEALRRYRDIRFGDETTPELLQSDSYYNFYLGLATGGNDFTRTYVYWVDDHPAAVVFALSIAGRVLVILSGFDQAQFKNQSIGALTFEQVARDCVARGDQWLDFTIGDEPYKTTFGARPEPMWILVRSHGLIGWLAWLAMKRIPNARAIVRRLLRRPAPVNAAPLSPSAADG